MEVVQLSDYNTTEAQHAVPDNDKEEFEQQLQLLQLMLLKVVKVITHGVVLKNNRNLNMA